MARLPFEVVMIVVLLSVAVFRVAPSMASGEVAVGVKTGDWIKSEYNLVNWPAGTPYPEWQKLEFRGVDGTNVTVRVTMHMFDGTEYNSTAPVDVVSGGQVLGFGGLVIPANLTAGDVVYVSGFGNLTIIGETVGWYAGASRTVVYASFFQVVAQFIYYWDKQTGVMVESFYAVYTTTVTAKATETNMWETWNLCDINLDLKVDMRDLGISSKAFGTGPGDLAWNPHADITGPEPRVADGKVNMRDLSLIASHYGEFYT